LSLRRRNYFSYSMGLALWRSYNERLFEDSDPAWRIVTHYDACLASPRAEMRRVLDFLGIAATEESEEAAAAAASSTRRNHRFSTRHLIEFGVSPATVALYVKMCDEAGWSEGRSPRGSDLPRPALAGVTAGGAGSAPGSGGAAGGPVPHQYRELNLPALESF